MTNAEAAERIARAVYAHGWSCLSYNEESLLGNEEFRGLVDALLDKIRRTDLLETDRPGHRQGRAPDPFSTQTTAGNQVEWTTPTTMRRAELWLSPQHRRAVLEIKEWSLDAYAGAHDAGAHRTILQQRMDTADREAFLREVRRVLRVQGCPDDKAQAFE